MSISKAVSANTIKPIETLWKGYRFRSRLEARWGVFFETLGIRWQYEPQGFQLGDGSAYLPDFYLPDQKTYVEIKPKINYRQRKIYMAGKFSGKPNKYCVRNNWREQILPNFINYSWDLHRSALTYIPGYHEYIGPYYANQRGVHSTHNAECSHGIDVESYDSCGVYSGHDSPDVYYPTRVLQFNSSEIIRNCLNAIERCDTFFAWVDSLDCFGTIAELGYAHAFGKEIFLGISAYLEIPYTNIGDPDKPHNYTEHSDLWFVENMAFNRTVAETPRQAYERFFVNLPSQFNKITQIPRGLLIAGDPYPGEYVAYCSDKEEAGPLCLLGYGLQIASFTDEEETIIKALHKARAARFEHGEAP